MRLPEGANLRKAGKNAMWVLGMGTQGGLMLALPVIGGLALGFWLDRLLGLAFPWLTLVFTLIGAMIGPALLYRWVTTTVVKQVKERRKADAKNEENEENPENGDA